MTFGDFILSLRERLQDTRDVSGNKITSAGSDGIRWTSSELVEICNAALKEFSLLARAYAVFPIFSQNMMANIVIGMLTTDSEGKKDLPANVIDVVDVIDGVESFGRLDPDKFLLYQKESESPRKGSKYYSIFRNVGTNAKEIRLLPADTYTITYSYIYGKSDYTSSDFSKSLPYGSEYDGMLLDLAEKEARSREHNWDRYNGIVADIKLKLGVPGERASV